MTIVDPIADMLTRIRNALLAKHKSVQIPSSTIKERIAEILKAEGFINDTFVMGSGTSKMINVVLKYADGDPLIEGLRRESNPGRRLYSGVDSLPKVQGGLGIAIISTSQGLMSDREARSRNLGGEVLCSIW